MEENNNRNTEQVNEDNPNTAEFQSDSQTAEEAPKDATQGSAEKSKSNWKKEAREWIVSIAAALLVVFIIRNFLFQIIRVDGESMNDTLLNNERLFVTVLDVRLNGADRGDVVICHYPDRGRTNFVKRVVAVPGDIVYREMGVTHVVYEVENEDGSIEKVDEMLDPRAVLYFMATAEDDYGPYVLGEDEYFVVGDNRYNSHDSRDWNDRNPEGDVGPITEDMLVGHVRNVIWPLDKIRTVE